MLTSGPAFRWSLCRAPAGSGYPAGALSISLPVIDTLELVSAVLIAATLLRERLASSPGQLAAQLAGGAAAVAGIAALSRSSVTAAEVRQPAAADPGTGPRTRPATK